MSDYFDLGSHTRTISTTSDEAQCWFDRGLNWCYGFNHEEAVRCFERALAADPACPMAWWGIAYAAGPNYNRAWHQLDAATIAAMLARTVDAVEHAQALQQHAGPVEQALIAALARRYQSTTPADDLYAW